MIVDGRKIAGDMYTKMREKVALLPHAPKLSIITCSPNFETQKYLNLKQKKAAEVGIVTEVIAFTETNSTEDFVQAIQNLISKTDGILVQLPLPKHVVVETILNTIPPTHDVDALNPETSAVLSPVVGALREILGEYGITTFEKYVTIIGSGKLVGIPAYHWFESQGAFVSVVTKDTSDITHYTRNADIIICGAGLPNLLTPQMVKDGVIILDAGTSEEGGVLHGDAHPDCAEKALIFTPVPGGIGPITIAVLLKNLIVLAGSK